MQLLHYIMNKHKSMYKPGVGEIKLCSGRFRNRGIIDMSVSLDELFDAVYVVRNVQPEEFELVIKCETETELSYVLIDMIEARRNTKHEVIVWTGEN